MKRQNLKTLLALVALSLMALTLHAQQSYFWVKNGIPRLPVFANTAAVTPVPTKPGAMVYSIADNTIMLFTGSAWYDYSSFSSLLTGTGYPMFSIVNGIPYLPLLKSTDLVATGVPAGSIYLKSDGTGQLRVNTGTKWAHPAVLSGTTVRGTFTTGQLPGFAGGVALPILAADPAVAAADKGAVYFNSSTNKLRLYNGASWTELTAVCPPNASGAVINCDEKTMRNFMGGYAYYDAFGRANDNTLFGYYLSTDAAGLVDATALTYSTTNAGWDAYTGALNNKYLHFVVRPVTGTIAGEPCDYAYQLVNCAPIASSVVPTMIGVRTMGVPYTMPTPGYSYFDKEENSDSATPLVKWYMGAAADGSDKVALNNDPAVPYVYNYQKADDFKYLFAGVIPVSTEANTTGVEVISTFGTQIIPNCAPQASVVINNADLIYNSNASLTVGYSYFDKEADTENVAGFSVHLYLATSATGTGKVEIGTNGVGNYVYNVADAGKYLYAEVTLAATSGNPTGDLATTAVLLQNCAPVVSCVVINGTLTAGQTLTAGYSFYDKEDDADGTPLYQWYRGDSNTPISGATSATYNSTGEAGNLIGVSVTPSSAAGVNPGVAVFSNFVQL
jgi:hypothetical protein